MKYLENKHTTNVSMLDGRILIPVGGYVPVADGDAEDSSVIEMLRRGFIAILKKEPTDVPMEGIKPEILIEKPVSANQGSGFPPGKEPKAKPAAVAVTEEVAVDATEAKAAKKTK